MARILSGMELFNYCKKILENPEFDVVSDEIMIWHDELNKRLVIEWSRIGKKSCVVKRETSPGISSALAEKIFQEIKSIKPEKIYVKELPYGIALRYDIWVLADLAYKKYRSLYSERNIKIDKIVSEISSKINSLRELFKNGTIYVKIIYNSITNRLSVQILDLLSELSSTCKRIPISELDFSLSSQEYTQFKIALYHEVEPYQFILFIEETTKNEIYLVPLDIEDIRY